MLSSTKSVGLTKSEGKSRQLSLTLLGLLPLHSRRSGATLGLPTLTSISRLLRLEWADTQRPVMQQNEPSQFPRMILKSSMAWLGCSQCRERRLKHFDGWRRRFRFAILIEAYSTRIANRNRLLQPSK